jgi:hypothetical protein
MTYAQRHQRHEQSDPACYCVGNIKEDDADDPGRCASDRAADEIQGEPEVVVHWLDVSPACERQCSEVRSFTDQLGANRL